MSLNPNRNQPIPFIPVPMEQQANSLPPSINNFPSNSQFNYPQLQSAASINYNEDANQLPSQKEIIQQEQAEELMKVSLERNEIDQDEILRMFQEEENRVEKNKKSNDKKKPYNQSGHSHNNNNNNKEKKSSTHHQATKKQPTQQSDEPFNKRHKQLQRQQQPLAYMSKTTSFKQLKSQPQSNSVYSTILNSQGIRQLLLQYKIQYRSSVYDPEWQKERYRLRQGFFQQLCVGVEEMRQKLQGQLSREQVQVLQKIKEISSQVTRTPYDFGIFKYCRNLVIQLDLQLFTHFHPKSKQPLSKDYKAQYKSLLTNLKDSQNYELRQKILCRKMDAEMLKVANEIQFLNEMKRNEIREKEQKLLKEFSVEHGMMKQEEGEEKEVERVGESGVKAISEQQYTMGESHHIFKPNQSLQSQDNNRDEASNNHSFSLSSLIAVNKYIQESTLTQLDELLSEGQMQRMRTRLDEDLKGECRNRMLKRFDSLVLSKV